ncbi:MAG: lysoplasmalogenase [Pirellulaceae bacterium]|nr:lysoplasmalogenase [Planctomycetales bacterium]
MHHTTNVQLSSSRFSHVGWISLTLLIVPLCLAGYALKTQEIVAKMGVPLSCAVLVILTAARTVALRRSAVWLVVALSFSAAGDWFLSNRNGRESYFLAGIGLFFIAHVGYLVFARHYGTIHRPTLFVLFGIFLPYYTLGIFPNISGSLLPIAVLSYLLISCIVLSAAAGFKRPRSARVAYIAGITLIVFSDTVISFREFLDWHGWDWLILPTYYLAHLCVTGAVVAIAESARQGQG